MGKSFGCIKRAAAVLLICVLTLCAAACGRADRTLNVIPPDEMRLTVYTSHKAEVYEPIIREFEDRTGIWVTVVSDGTNKLLERIRNEGGSATADVMFGGGVDTLSAYSDCFEPYICEQESMIDSRYRCADGTWTAFSVLPMVIIYNNKLVYVNSVPSGWEELMQERWKGKVAFAMPDASGTGYTALATIMQILGRRSGLAKLKNVVAGDALSSSGAVVDTVAAGTKLAGITLEEAALKKLAQGAEISIVYPKEGTSAVPDGSALVRGAEHPENAKKFLDFVTGSEVQLMLTQNCCRRSVRTDVADGDDMPEVDLIDYDLEWATLAREEILEKWNEEN